MRPLRARCQVGGLTAEVALESLALPHVADRAMGPDELPVADHPGRPDLDRDRIGVLARHLDGQRVDLARVRLDRVPDLRRRVASREGQEPEVLADDFVGQPAGELLETVAHERDLADLVDRPDDIGRGLDEIPVAGLGVRSSRSRRARSLMSRDAPWIPANSRPATGHGPDLIRDPPAIAMDQVEPLGGLDRRIGDELGPALDRRRQRRLVDKDREVLADVVVDGRPRSFSIDSDR